MPSYFSLAISFDMHNMTVEILHHAQIGQNAYTKYVHTIYIYMMTFDKMAENSFLIYNTTL